MNKVYIVTTSLALAMGWVAGFETQGLTAQAQRPYSTERQIGLEVTPGQQSTIENWAQARFCTQINEEFELSGPQACAGNKSFQRLVLQWLTGEDGVRRLRADAWVMIRGVWTPQSSD